MEKKVDWSGEGWEAMARGRGRDGGCRHPQMVTRRAFYRLRFFSGTREACPAIFAPKSENFTRASWLIRINFNFIIKFLLKIK